MPTASYLERRKSLETYFDRTAVDAWSKLTSDTPVSGIRATVRAGRDRMRNTLLSWLPDDLYGMRVLDAGCGTGALSVEAARRGAQVTAIDLSSTLVDLAKNRTPDDVKASITFLVGDMLNPALGAFDYCVAMDSLIHYRAADMAQILNGFGGRTKTAILFTFAPRTPALTAMHFAGRIFPKSDRAPNIEPVSEKELRKRLKTQTDLSRLQPGRDVRISSGFYVSHAMELAA